MLRSLLILLLLIVAPMLLPAQKVVRISPPPDDSTQDPSNIRPGLASVGDTILVTWQVVGASRPYKLALWPTNAGGSVIIDSLKPDTLGPVRADSPYVRVEQLEWTEIDTHTDPDGAFVLASTYRRIDRGYRDSLDWDLIKGEEWGFYVPTPNGWRLGKRVMRRMVNPDPGELVPFTYHMPMVKYDPNRAEHVILTAAETGAFNDTGTVWSWASPRTGTAQYDIVPAGFDSVLTIADSAAYLWVDGLLVDSLPLPKYADYAPDYYRLLGGRFLRVYSHFTTDTVHVELFDLENGLIAQRDLPFASVPDMVAVAQRRGDSVIAIVASAAGIRGTYLTADLDTIRSGVLLSDIEGGTTRLAAAFVGDSLYAVWQDLRNGTSAIYGTHAAAPAAPVAGVPIGSSSAISLDLHVAPAPARDRLLVDVRGRDRVDRMTIIDVLGRRVLQIDGASAMNGGHIPLAIDVRSLPPGAYRLIVEAGGAHASAPVVVLR